MNSWIYRIDRRHGQICRSIIAALEAAIHTGQVRPGDVLPSQRLMADFMGVHVNTVNRAMREAARLGLTTGRAGYGTTVIGRTPASRFHGNPSNSSRLSNQHL
ncbi:GntR family transcriptional regulator [Paraburkholderia caballeronis]|uniref:GntR family transcriptional regulator n=1 Tax=Paraburkholderia caballeronis TaxID=416943 RepID=UPI000B83DD85|nr:GntR family transcriptional regulator [Paraburkholderia caballeronis]